MREFLCFYRNYSTCGDIEGNCCGDHIDLYYQHRIDPKIEPETVAKVMAELIKEGKILSWGVCGTWTASLCGTMSELAH